MSETAIRIAREYPVSSRYVEALLKECDGNEALTRQLLDFTCATGAAFHPSLPDAFAVLAAVKSREEGRA